MKFMLTFEKKIMFKYFLFITIILLGCGSKENQGNNLLNKDTKTIQFDSIVISKSYGNPDSVHSSDFKLVCPILKNGDTLVCKKINDSIYEFIVSAISEITWEENAINYRGKNYQQIAETFNNIVANAKKDDKQGNQFQSFYYEGKVKQNANNILTIAFEFYTYSGGAHGFGGELYKNFSLKDGSKLNIKDCITDTTKFKELVKDAFYTSRKQIAIQEKMEYNPNGYFWDNGFALPENIGFTPKGMIFNYLPYEAASYAEGNLTFEIPYEKLVGVIKIE
jgi:Deacetylase PdaC/Protein of unknown function (DUF3298)